MREICTSGAKRGGCASATPARPVYSTVFVVHSIAEVGNDARHIDHGRCDFTTEARRHGVFLEEASACC